MQVPSGLLRDVTLFNGSNFVNPRFTSENTRTKSALLRTSTTLMSRLKLHPQSYGNVTKTFSMQSQCVLSARCSYVAIER